jgi:hypothetical protein
MKNLSYKQLAELIGNMTDEQQNMTATVYINGEDEFYPINSIEFSKEGECDALDDNHPYFII